MGNKVVNSKESSVKRRKILKSIATGSGAIIAGQSLPDNWAKPVVNAVMLPAHASTTDDTGSQPPGITTTSAPAPTPPPCDIVGEYCWVQPSFMTNISVQTDGSITITRIRTAGTAAQRGRTWVGTGMASNGAQGGTFAIQAHRTLPAPERPGNVRDFTGTLICGETTISGTFDNPNNRTPPRDYDATQDACRANS